MSMAVGNLKNVSIILVSVWLFGNECTPIQFLGFFVTTYGVWLNSQKGKEEKVDAASPE
jgi:hypothetical protein